MTSNNMYTISNKEARKNPIYRDIMAAALWAYRDIKQENAKHFVNDPAEPRYFCFCSSAYGVIVDFVEYDRHTGRMHVEAKYEEAPTRRRLIIFE